MQFFYECICRILKNSFTTPGTDLWSSLKIYLFIYSLELAICSLDIWVYIEEPTLYHILRVAISFNWHDVL